jgi:uncharacterized membrane protein YagU involved in acid resistance
MAKPTETILSAPAQGLLPRKQGLPVILKAGLFAGTLDIIAAFVNYAIKSGKDPLPILNFIASGVVGKEEAYDPTNTLIMRVLGLLLHFLIATIFAAIFYYAWPLFRRISQRWIVTGLLYGVLVWLAMNLVVVPLSSTPVMKHTTSGVITNMLILMFCVGLPIAWVTYRSRSTT